MISAATAPSSTFSKTAKPATATRAGSPFWLDVTNDWARDELGLDDDDREYFVAGLNLVVDRVYPKTRHWLAEPANPDLDDEIWLFARVWLDHYGPFRETTR